MKAIRKLFKFNTFSVKEFEQMLEPTDAPATNPFQRFAEETAFEEFLTFLRKLLGLHICIVSPTPYSICLIFLDGSIMKTDLDCQKITVVKVYRFITASKIVPRVLGIY